VFVCFVLSLFLCFQIFSGLILFSFYSPDLLDAFDAIQFLFRECSLCFISKFVHISCSSLIFLFVYIHILKGFLYSSNIEFKDLVWFVGVILLFLFLFVGFSGYSLVLGQMSYWALTVISNLITCIPLIGLDLLVYVWGNSMINNFSLKRFALLHCICPFFIIFLALFHIIFVHFNYSGFVFNLNKNYLDKLPFIEYFWLKDLLFLTLFLVILVFLIFGFSFSLVHTDNFIYAMIYVTPFLIEPEWYFLPFYAVIRSIPHKLIGCISLIFSAFVIIYPIKISLCFGQISESIPILFILNFVSFSFIAIFHATFPLIECSIFCLGILWFCMFV